METNATNVIASKHLTRFIRKNYKESFTFDPRNIVLNMSDGNKMPLKNVFKDMLLNANFSKEMTETAIDSFVKTIAGVTGFNKASKKIGVFVAAKNDETGIVTIGWSRCHTAKLYTANGIKHGDKFDKVRGIKQATERATLGHSLPMPHSITEQATSFADRASRYYKVKFEDIVIVGLTPDTFINQTELEIEKD